MYIYLKQSQQRDSDSAHRYLPVWPYTSSQPTFFLSRLIFSLGLGMSLFHTGLMEAYRPSHLAVRKIVLK